MYFGSAKAFRMDYHYSSVYCNLFEDETIKDSKTKPSRPDSKPARPESVPVTM